MRTANTYRGARRKEAKAMGLEWRRIDAINVGGTRMITDPPFRYMNKPATKEAMAAAMAASIAAPPSSARDDGTRYNAAEVRRIRAERGVGPAERIAEAIRSTFKKTKRK